MGNGLKTRYENLGEGGLDIPKFFFKTSLLEYQNPSCKPRNVYDFSAIGTFTNRNQFLKGKNPALKLHLQSLC